MKGYLASSNPFPLRAGCAALLLVLSNLLPSQVLAGQETVGSLFPKPGSYTLYRIKKAPEAFVLEKSAWWPERLSTYTTGKVTLLSFFYATCRDPAGCPVIWSSFESLHSEIIDNPRLHGKVRLVMVSLDPSLDRPDQLQLFSLARRSTQMIAPWHFLTTWSDDHLAPILKDFGQSAGRQLDADGMTTPNIIHQVKFFLIDSSSWIREIYTSGFFNTEVALNDIETLLLEEQADAKSN